MTRLSFRLQLGVMMDCMSYAAVAISVMALWFTVVSFWWLHARPGEAADLQPTTWAAYVNRERSAIRLPLVLHNTGAATLVVTALRLRFVEGGELMAWEWTRTRVDPKADDIEDVTAPFSIPGREARELVAEFAANLATLRQQWGIDFGVDPL